MSYSTTYLKSRSPRELGELAGLPSQQGDINTPHKAFNREANHPERGYVGTGNVVSGVQRSSFVRAHSKTRCNGFAFQPGELRDADLKMFRRTMPSNMMRRVEQLSVDRDLIVYEFRSPATGGKHTTHGWLITDTFHRHIETASLPSEKSMRILHDMQKRLSWSDKGAIDPVATEQIEAAAEGIDLDELQALARQLGLVVTPDWESCRQHEVYFTDEDPISAFRPGAERELVRSNDPALTAAMACIREGITAEQLRELRQEIAGQLAAEAEEQGPDLGM